MRGHVRVLIVFTLLAGGAGVAPPAEAMPVAQGRPSPAPSQALAMPDLTAWVGLTITSVQIEIEGQPTDNASLLGLVGLRAGVPLVEAAVREGLAHVAGLGRYESVTVAARGDGDGVALLFSLAPFHPVTRMAFRGDTGLDGRSLERAVLEQVGGRLSAITGEVAADAVRRELADEGFYRPSVNWAVARAHEPHLAELVFTVEAGPRQRIGRIVVAGESPLSVSQVLETLRISTGAPYRRRAIEDGLRSVAEGLRARRYYEASASHFPTGEGESVNLTLTIEAGPVFDIIVTGDPLPPGGVDQWIPIRRENSADEDLLEDSALRIQWALQQKGFWRARVDVRREEQPGGRQMVVTVKVTQGRRYRLREITMAGNTFLPTSDAKAILALHPGEPFREDEVRLRVQVLLNAYAAAGYAASADLTSEELPSTRADGDGEVLVRLTITEGPRRTIGAILIVGAVQVPEAAVRQVIRSRVGQPLRDAQIRQDRDAVETLYRNAGFESAAVNVALTNEPAYTATFTIVEGRQVIVDHVIVAGNSRVRTDTILRQITLKPGQPFGQAARSDSVRRLNELAIFRRVSIAAAPGSVGDDHVDVIVQVEEAAAITVGYGGGLEFARTPRTVADGVEDRFELAPRGFLELGRRNLFGGNRSINLFSRLSLRPNNDPADPERDGRGFGVSEYRVTGSYRAARAWGTNTDVVVSTSVERAIRTSFTYVRRGMNAEALRRLTPKISVFSRYALDSTRLFDTRISDEDQPLIDRLFPQIRLSSVSAGLVWDRRDNILDPTAGGWISADAELAAQTIGSEVGFAKTFLQATAFRRITRAGRVVLAGRLQVGLARGFERQVPHRDADGQPITGPSGEMLTYTVADLPAGRRFFAGGSTSVRGFQQDRLGAPAILNPAGLSNGGNGLVVMNGEVRTLVLSTVSLVAFVDGGNVFKRVGDIAPAEFRGAVGLGLRYRSPLGPLRLDFGFKLDRRFVANTRERGWEFHLSIGEAF